MITGVMVRLLFQNKDSNLNLLFRIYYMIAFLLTFSVLISLVFNQSIYEKRQITIQHIIPNYNADNKTSNVLESEFILENENIYTVQYLEKKLDNDFFDIDQIRVTKKVPNIIVSHLPRDFKNINSSLDRKNLFIKIALPLIVKENAYLISENLKIKNLKNRLPIIKRKEAVWLNKKMEEYKVKSGSIDELMMKVDAVPISLALSQAAVESGWGTSRFAYKGNALFGQYIWEEGKGIVPKDRDDTAIHEIKSFKNLKSSVASYMKNLNSNHHYDEFRINRFIMRINGIPLNGTWLSQFLYNYSTDEEYPDKIKEIIRTNNLEDFDNVKIKESPLELIKIDII